MSDVRDRKSKAAHVWDRPDHDWYVEPEGVTDLLLGAERFVGPILDPACGGGNIVRACRRAGYEVIGSDIVDRTGGAAWFVSADFLADDHFFASANIICNPPFFRAKGTEAFARKALAVASGKVAIFADVRFLASGKRARGLFSEFPPTRIWQLADRPSCPPGAYLAAGNVAGGGTSDWCWIVWCKSEDSTVTEFCWLFGNKDKIHAK